MLTQRFTSLGINALDTAFSNIPCCAHIKAAQSIYKNWVGPDSVGYQFLTENVSPHACHSTILLIYKHLIAIISVYQLMCCK